ncbi:MAG: bifunctional metallophosphatase/5'-nucleotidase, partial [Erysipelotrichia bacterium]|nr:bifunctional metallophosphatase/5'-nucleotidase [Erysipelotrichia bacterium]
MKNLLLKLVFILFLLPAVIFAQTETPSEVTELTILHTSDIHAHLMTFDSPIGKGVGGYARIKAYKEQLEKDGKDVLMLSSGDIFQGTFFYRFFQGIPDIQFMNQTGYAAMTLGNHEFDNGQQALAEAISHARFPILSANIEFKSNIALKNQIKPYIFVNAGKERSPVKIALIGMTTENLKGIVHVAHVQNLNVQNAGETLKKYLPEIKQNNPDMIILLSHLGWTRDLELFEQFPELDGILGGHTHMAIDPPTVYAGPRGHRFISQPGEFGQYVTRYDLIFRHNAANKIEIAAAGLMPMAQDLPVDFQMTADITALWGQIQQKVSAVIGQTKVWLNGERNFVRNFETNLGNLVADCFATIVESDMSLINGGGVRSSIATGPVTIGDCLNVLPFDNYLVRLKLTGASIKKIFASVAEHLGQAGGFGGFMQVSRGLEVDYNHKQPLIKFHGQPLEDEKVYTVTT